MHASVVRAYMPNIHTISQQRPRMPHSPRTCTQQADSRACLHLHPRQFSSGLCFLNSLSRSTDFRIPFATRFWAAGAQARMWSCTHTLLLWPHESLRHGMPTVRSPAFLDLNCEELGERLVVVPGFLALQVASAARPGLYSPIRHHEFVYKHICIYTYLFTKPQRRTNGGADRHNHIHTYLPTYVHTWEPPRTNLGHMCVPVLLRMEA